MGREKLDQTKTDTIKTSDKGVTHLRSDTSLGNFNVKKVLIMSPKDTSMGERGAKKMIY